MEKELHAATPEEADKLRQYFERVQKLERIVSGQDHQTVLPESADVYLAYAQPGEYIPGRSGDTPGALECCIFKVDVENIDDLFGEDREILPIVEADGDVMRRMVYNIFEYPVIEFPTIVVRSKFGPFLVHERPDPDATTTTTTADVGYNPCSGYCWFDWVDSDKIWNERESTCASATTTTEAPPCPQPTTTTDPGSTTTTTTEPCHCDPPTHCGEEGDCVKTSCTTQEVPEPPDCGQTTTTTTPGATTTTTTPDCDCGSGCEWIHLFGVDAPSWRLVSYDCAPNEPYNTKPHCGPCVPPTTHGIFCQLASTPCKVECQPVDLCYGDCGWFAIPFLFGLRWLQSSYCSTNSNCGCDRPSFPPSSTKLCSYTSTPCRPRVLEPPNPFTSCCNGSTSTTTTTTSECGLYCKWEWRIDDPSYWGPIENPCLPECPCSPPGYDGEEDCEVAWTKCGTNYTTSTTTTTTNEPTTTTTSTTTTTTCSIMDCCGYPLDGCTQGMDSCECVENMGTPVGDCVEDCPPCEGECSYECIDGVLVVVAEDCFGFSNQCDCHLEGDSCAPPFSMVADCAIPTTTTTPEGTTTTTTIGGGGGDV